MQDKLELNLLLDYYGAFLTDNQRELLIMSTEEDYSLSEIAEMRSISRQGVRDAIQRGERQLYEMEQKLGLIGRDKKIAELINTLKSEISAHLVESERISMILAELLRITEGDNGI